MADDNTISTKEDRIESSTDDNVVSNATDATTDDHNDDTATESSYSEESDYEGSDIDDDNLSQYSYEDDDNGRPLPMPPLKYARIIGSLPRDNNSANDSSNITTTALSVKVTCSTIGRVVIRPSPSASSADHHDGVEGDNTASSSTITTKGTTVPPGVAMGVHISEYEDDEDADRSITHIHHVITLVK